jgi:hypothetical protein
VRKRELRPEMWVEIKFLRYRFVAHDQELRL